MHDSFAVIVALSLAQAGEFGFVLLSFTVEISVIPSAIADQLLLIVALSMLLTPLLFIIYERFIVPRYEVGKEREADPIDEKCKVLIAGHGRVGGIVNRMLRGAGFSTTVIDFSSSNLEMLRALNVKAYYGDATRPDLLHAAGIDEASILVITLDNKKAITELARYVIAAHPHIHVVARAVDRHYLREMAGLYKPDVPIHQNQAYAKKARGLNEEWARQLKTENTAKPTL